MRKIIFIILFSHFCQAQSFKKNLENDVCDCLQKTDSLDQEVFLNCFASMLTKYDAEFEQLIDKNSDVSHYDQGVILGRNLFDDMQVGLVQNCDKYFFLFEDLKRIGLQSMKIKYPISQKDSLEKNYEKIKNIDNLLEVANWHFANGYIETAEEKYNQILKLDANYLPSKMLLAFLYEEKKKYPEALKLYEEVYLASEKKEITLYIEIIKRKMKK